MKCNILIVLLLLSLTELYSQDSLGISPGPAEKWADSILQTLSTDEMIGQLMIVRANNPNQDYFAVIDQYISKYNIGGVTFFGGHPSLQARQTNAWQKVAKTPLFISIDGEWGPAMRLDSILAFPYQMTLGAAADDSVIYRMGLEVARQSKRLGIHINFAPVVDINSNPANPVIHMRSFGENREDVARKGTMYMKGMQDGGLIVTAKHFPGHGDTGTDSHHTLPVVAHTRTRLDSIELYPFRQLISAGLDGVMIAHLNVPALEPSANTASTLSPSIVTGVLRNELGFNGLIVTDALDMKGVTLNNKPGEIELEALKAGNDVLLLSANVPEGISRIKLAIETGEITAELVRERCRKILIYKYKAGLNQSKPVETAGLISDLSGPQTEVLIRELFEQSVTLVRNQQNMLPLSGLDTLKIASVSAGYGRMTPFQERLDDYAPMQHFFLPKDPEDAVLLNLTKDLDAYNLVILGIHNTSIWSGSPFGISSRLIKWVNDLSRNKKVILVLFASPYSLDLFAKGALPEAIVMSYQDHPVMQDRSAQALFGGIPVNGKLPVTCGKNFPAGISIQTQACRLKYIIPEEIGLDPAGFQPIDSMIREAISKKVFPGCQIWAASHGRVFFRKAYGHHTYDQQIPVKNEDVYDLASVTKVAASTLAMMRLAGEKKIDPDQKLEVYLPYLKDSGKGEIIIREMMAHQSRLKPWIPFYTYTLKDKMPDSAIYRNAISEDFPVRVAENMYIRKNYQYALYDSILSSDLLKTSSYKYSDLGFYLIPEIVKSVVNKPFDDYLDRIFYKPLGLTTTGFLPRKRISLDRIPPTEKDTVFRKQLVQGDVHDQGAAMLGGVSGHAGLFSNANDLGIIAEMLLRDGTYGNVHYLDSATIHEFTRQQFPLNDNRRGIGVDKPLPEYSQDGPCCKSASPSSFGHSGFTGTYIWIDPATQLTYVFLSNRVYPDASNNKLASSNLRAKIHQVFYDLIEKNTIFAN